jgi:hypothetical protein
MKTGFRHIGKRVLISALFLMLCIPMLQHVFNYFEIKPLGGYQQEVASPEFGMHNWFEGEFQAKADAYLNAHFGFRSTLVRAYNQFYFYVFNYSQTQGIVIGKDNHLFEENYINAHLGRDYLGEEVIDQKVQKLSYIRDVLAKIARPFLISALLLIPALLSFDFSAEEFFIIGDSPNLSLTTRAP